MSLLCQDDSVGKWERPVGLPRSPSHRLVSGKPLLSEELLSLMLVHDKDLPLNTQLLQVSLSLTHIKQQALDNDFFHLSLYDFALFLIERPPKYRPKQESTDMTYLYVYWSLQRNAPTPSSMTSVINTPEDLLHF